jgi:hypothetical protein
VGARDGAGGRDGEREAEDAVQCGRSVLDGREEYEDGDEEEERGAFPLAAVRAGWTPTGTGRNRSVDELDGEPQRGGTPLKRARTVEPPSP